MSSRSARYALLSRMFSYPDADLLSELPRLARQAQWSGRLPSENQSLPDLEAAYTGLFINRLGGVASPPYGSAYLDEEGGLMGESCRDVEAAYRGCALVPGSGSEPADALATELEFMFFLTDKEEVLRQRGEDEAADELRGQQEAFWQKLLSPWLAPFCRRLLKEKPLCDFYQSAALRLLELQSDEDGRLGGTSEN